MRLSCGVHIDWRYFENNIKNVFSPTLRLVLHANNTQKLFERKKGENYSENARSRSYAHISNNYVMKSKIGLFTSVSVEPLVY